MYYALAIAPLPAGATVPQWTCVVSKKVMRRAVDRNRAKRQCRAAFMETRKDMPLSPLAYIVHVKSAARSAAYSELLSDIRTLLLSASREAQKRSTIPQ